jgi:hypothetical protein
LGRGTEQVSPTTAAEADIRLVAVGALSLKDIGVLVQNWSEKIVADVRNCFTLPS